MAFSPPVVGCLVKKRLAKGEVTGTRRTPPPGYALGLANFLINTASLCWVPMIHDISIHKLNRPIPIIPRRGLFSRSRGKVTSRSEIEHKFEYLHYRCRLVVAAQRRGDKATTRKSKPYCRCRFG